ncbi:MucR family transcriptional regulator [Ferrovibrio sp.]|uniref:MucR family transcriptional regulator n=1 Tax=Ferrovibrio sp. TaxID=1917215 RepID=UPI0035B25230
MLDAADKSELLSLTADIVSAHVSNNRVETADLPALIKQIYGTLSGLGGEAPTPVVVAEKPQPAISVKRSVTPEYIICLEDGKKLKMLKRHLMSHYNMTPEQYRERWGLPADYPMVAPNYALHRQALAKKIGLGKARRKAR